MREGGPLNVYFPSVGAIVTMRSGPSGTQLGHLYLPFALRGRGSRFGSALASNREYVFATVAGTGADLRGTVLVYRREPD